MDLQKALLLLDATPPKPSATPSKDKRVADRSIGAYIIMHADNVEAAKVAEHLDNVLPPAAKQKLHYVVLLACSLTRGNVRYAYSKCIPQAARSARHCGKAQTV